MRLIDADALIKALRLEYPMMPMFKESQKEWGIKTEGYRKAEEVIKEAPSIDIVRCGECKYWRNTDAEKIPIASIACGNMHADDFCSYGVRKTDTTAEEKPTPIRDYMVYGERKESE